MNPRTNRFYRDASNCDAPLDPPEPRKPTALEIDLGNLAEDLVLHRIESDILVGEAFCETNDGRQFRDMLMLLTIPKHWADAALRYIAERVVIEVMARPRATQDCLDYVTQRAHAALGVEPNRSASTPPPGAAPSASKPVERPIPIPAIGVDTEATGTPVAGPYSTDRRDAA